MSVRTIGNRQNVSGSTMDVDRTTTIRVAVTGGLTTNILVESVAGFPATGTIFFPGGYSFIYTSVNSSTAGLGIRFIGSSQSLPSVAVGALVTSPNDATLTSPINPFRNTAIIAGTDEYIFTETGVGEGEGPINFPAGSSIVVGGPVIDPSIDLATGTTTTNQNAPYIYLEATPTWSETSAYSVDDEVSFNGVKYKCTTAVDAGTNAGIDIVWGGTWNSSNNEQTQINGWTGGQLTDNDTKTFMTMVNDPNNNQGYYGGVTGEARLFAASTWFADASVFINAMVAIINTNAVETTSAQPPADNTGVNFNRINPVTSFGITAEKLSTTSMRLSAKDGFTIPSGTISTTGTSQDAFTSATAVAASPNSNPTVDTSNWTEDGVPIIEGWNTNTNSIVPLDSETGFPGIASRVKFRFENVYDSTNVDGKNWTMVNSDDTTAAPVFYGVDFNADRGASMSFVGNAANSYNSPTGQGTPQFHDCTWTVNSSADVRWLGPNMLINGFQYTNYGSGARFEFGTAPIFAPRGLALNAPNVPDLRVRAFLVFCVGGRVPANNAANSYIFENPTAGNLCIFNSTNASNNDSNIGCIAVNPVDSPLVPYATTNAGIATTTDFANIIMPSKNRGDGGFTVYTGSGTILVNQRIRINFPSTGWTVRVVKTGTSTYTRNDSNDTSRTILWQSRSRTSCGGLVRNTTDTYNTTAEYFPTSGAFPDEDTMGSTTPGSGGGTRNLTLFGTVADGNRLAENDVPVYYGLDDTITGSSVDLLLPVYTTDENAADDTRNDTLYFNNYKIICQNDAYGTQVFNYTFDPAGSNYPTGFGNATWGNIVETVPESLIDNAYTNSITDLDTSPIESLQDIYNSLKIFERLRTSNTDYNASHRTSDTTFLTRTGKSFTTSFANIGITSIGRSVKTSGTSVNLKLASDWTNGNTDNVDQLVASGNIELSLFPDLTGVNLKAATFTTLPTAIPAVNNLEGTYTKSDNTKATFTFTNSDVTNLSLVNSGTASNDILGTRADGTAITESDFASVSPSSTGTATNKWNFPVTKNIVVTLPTINKTTAFRATYAGTALVEGTSTGQIQKKVGTTNTTFEVTVQTAGDFTIGVWADGFNYTFTDIGSAETGTLALIPIAPDFLDFDTTLSTIGQNIVDNFTGSFASNVYTAEIDGSEIGNTTNHTALLGAEARLITRRLLETPACIELLQNLVTADGAPAEFFTYSPAGWTIATPTKLQIIYDETETKDLIINVFPQNKGGVAAWDKIVSDTPSLSPIFPPAEFTTITQSEGSVQAFGKVVADEVSPAFKKTSRLIPVNDSDFPNI